MPFAKLLPNLRSMINRYQIISANLICCAISAILICVVGCASSNSGGNPARERQIGEAIDSGDEVRIEREVAKNIGLLPRSYFASMMDFACSSGDNKTVRILLKHHIEPSRSALSAATRSGNLELRKMLLAAGCDPNEEDPISKRSGLAEATSKGNTSPPTSNQGQAVPMSTYPDLNGARDAEIGIRMARDLQNQIKSFAPSNHR